MVPLKGNSDCEDDSAGTFKTAASHPSELEQFELQDTGSSLVNCSHISPQDTQEQELRKLLREATSVEPKRISFLQAPLLRVTQYDLTEMCKVYKARGILTKQLVYSVLHQRGLGSSQNDQLNELEEQIERLLHASLVFHVGQPPVLPSQFIAPSIWTHPEPEALQQLWPIPLLPGERVRGCYYFFDEYNHDTPGGSPPHFFERLVGRCVVHDGHNNDHCRVLNWDQGAAFYRNKVQVFLLKVEQQDSQGLLLIGRRARHDVDDDDSSDDNPSDTIWTELALFHSEVTALLADFPGHHVRLEAVCQHSAAALEANEAKDVLSHLQEDLHAVPYPSSWVGLPPLHELRQHCKQLSHIPCGRCNGRTLAVDCLAPRETTALGDTDFVSPVMLSLARVQDTSHNRSVSQQPTSVRKEFSQGSFGSGRTSPSADSSSGGSTPKRQDGGIGRLEPYFGGSVSTASQGSSIAGAQLTHRSDSTPTNRAPKATEFVARSQSAAGASGRPSEGDRRKSAAPPKSDQSWESCAARTVPRKAASSSPTAGHDTLGLASGCCIMQSLRKIDTRGGLAAVLSGDSNEGARPVNRTLSFEGAAASSKPRSAPTDIPAARVGGALAKFFDPAGIAPRLKGALLKEWAFQDDNFHGEHDTLDGEANVHTGQLELSDKTAAITSSPIAVDFRAGVTLEVRVQLSGVPCKATVLALQDTSSGASAALLLDASCWAVQFGGSGVPHKFNPKTPERVLNEPLHLVLVLEPWRTSYRIRCFRDGEIIGWLVRNIPARAAKEYRLILGNKDRESEKYVSMMVFCARLYKEALDDRLVGELYRQYPGALEEGG